ncbi:MAG: aldo/keto reductase [Methyloceanibacter sp.]|nr:aldo/keto reductase [Methyloceanibacter sp.]
MPTVKLPSGKAVPKLGQGTWGMGEDPRKRRQEVAAIELGLEIGMTLIDTAEMYGNGGAEEIVGEAIEGRREDVFIVSKVLPDNANKVGMIASCEWSLARLGIERLDLYLLHWRGRHPLEATLEGFHALMREGLIAAWGVSNFDTADMEELAALAGGDQVQTDQVLYNLHRRGIEHELLPWCGERKIPVMAYSPFEQGRILRDPALNSVAAGHRVSPACVALAWVLLQDDVIAIPKSSNEAHVQENAAALDLVLSQQDLELIERAFPRPEQARPLEML